MSTGATIVIIVLAIAVLALVVWFARAQMRRKQLRERFGPEYDRAIEEGKDRRVVEREFADREKRHAELEIRPLSRDTRERYAHEWALIQADFVDNPTTAVAEADRLVTVVMAERGYPTEGYQQQLADLSVRHAATIGHYRTAHELRTRNNGNGSATDGASTEELREAMVHYRALFEDLLESDAEDRDRVDTQQRR